MNRKGAKLKPERAGRILPQRLPDSGGVLAGEVGLDWIGIARAHECELVIGRVEEEKKGKEDSPGYWRQGVPIPNIRNA